MSHMSAAPVRARPRTKPSDVRRDELLRAGERLFIAHGVAATSIDDIAAGADIAKGTFYLHFASKDDLVAALRERFAEAHCAAIESHVAHAAQDDWMGKLAAWVGGSIAFYLDRVALHDALFHAPDLHPKRRQAKSDNKVVAALAGLLDDGTRAGAWRIDAPAMTAVLLFNALHGAVDHAIAHGTEGARDALIRAVRRFFRRAVGVEDGPAIRR